MCRIKGLDTSGVAIGVMHDFGQAALPFGYVACDGASVLRAGIYAALFAKIGTTFGFVDGTHFNLPSRVGKTSIMPGTYTDAVSGAITRVAGAMLGAEKHAITGAETGSHTHGITDPGHVHAIRGIADQGLNAGQADDITAGSAFLRNTDLSATGISVNPTAASTAHNNMQPTLVIGNVGIAYI